MLPVTDEGAGGTDIRVKTPEPSARTPIPLFRAVKPPTMSAPASDSKAMPVWLPSMVKSAAACGLRMRAPRTARRPNAVLFESVTALAAGAPNTLSDEWPSRMPLPPLPVAVIELP